MKSIRLLFLLIVIGALTAASAQETAAPDGAIKMMRNKPGAFFIKTAGAGEREKVTFLGIEVQPIDPALTRQLHLPPEMGLVVRTIVPDSPAAGVLEPYDILLKFEDQLLIEPYQLGVLVRAKKGGDEVPLTVVRDGKEQVIKVKLGEHEIPKMKWMLGMGAPRAPRDGANVFYRKIGPLPPLPPEEADRFFGLMHEEGGGPANTRIIVRRQGMDPHTSVINLGRSNLVYSDDQGTLELTINDGKRQLVAKGKDGKVVFSGPINTEAERHAVPPEILARLKLIETPGNLGYKADRAFQRADSPEEFGALPAGAEAPDVAILSPSIL